MQAWEIDHQAHRLRRVERARPRPAAGELLVKVLACGLCRTDLHLIDDEIPARRPGIIPGHQVVGDVVEVGVGTAATRVGERVGVAWLRGTCGVCDYCRDGRENLCARSTYTGWDHDGGLAEFVTVPEGFAYGLDHDADPVASAPLLCAGIIGYRALARANVPPGGTLTLYGFGSSAHLTARLAMAAGIDVVVISRGEANRALARELGASFVGDDTAVPPTGVDSAIVFAPVGEIVSQALRGIRPGGTAVVAGIHLSPIPTLIYRDSIFYERDLRSVTANTRADGAAFLRLARHLNITPRVTEYEFGSAADAVDDLRGGDSSGSIVIRIGAF
jgi:propanol-preferring alcohol dehydrogenase